MHKSRSHFGDKDVFGHLKDARMRGHQASQEDHGTESPGYFSAAVDSGKETAIVFFLLSILMYSFGIIAPVPQHKLFFPFFGVLSVGWILWKVGRSAIIGWSRMSRLNRLMREEKYEIETNPKEEREELTEIYKAKGFQGELLERVIDILMSDDHKLLLVMLEEELGVGLENCDHPLKQALGAAVGTFLSLSALLIGHLIAPMWGVAVAAYVVVIIAAYATAKVDRLRPLPLVIWNLGMLFLASLTTYFFAAFIAN